MRFWFDTEFIDDGRTIDLLSIGIVAEDGREYYAVSQDADWSKASDWVAKNVLPQLDYAEPKPRAEIRDEILSFIGHQVEYDRPAGTKQGPEIWSWYGSYDFVALCQLFGPMVDLPREWPMFVRDVRQLCDELENPRIPSQRKGFHHALKDARWTRQAWEFLMDLKRAKDVR